jgi:hypothetical protein
VAGYRPRGNAQRHGEKQLSVEQAKAQLTMFLYNAPIRALDAFTVEGLQRMYRVQPRDIEYLLTICRQKRAGEAR